MNTFQSINVEYLRSSRTIENILVSNKFINTIFYVYNHEGVSFRVFKNCLNLINFFQDKNEEDYHFNTEEELDRFLSEVVLV